jgi:hypothetical protein
MWYSAKLLYESEVLDGLPIEPLCEESIILVEGKDELAARGEALRVAKESEHSYLNPDGKPVNWRFVELMEFQDLCEEKIYSGIEVFSTMFRKESE